MTIGAHILTVVEARPYGLTQKEIRALMNSGGHAVSPNVVRATLHRLKQQKKIAEEHGRWFSTGAESGSTEVIG